jgi:hypothetical protein
MFCNETTFHFPSEKILVIYLNELESYINCREMFISTAGFPSISGMRERFLSVHHWLWFIRHPNT